MRTALTRLVPGALAVALTAGGVIALAAGRDPFPHEEHAGLFPLCEGCHQGVPQGDRATFYPSPAQCSSCHDGVEEDRVDWQGPTEELDNLVFDHRTHPVVDEQGVAIACTTCHTAAGAPRMAVAERPVVERCLACHEHQAASHLADAACATCHVPLATAPFDAERIASLPKPDDHEGDDFIAAGHGALAEGGVDRCTVCHTRELCVSCHVDAATVTQIADMPAAAGLVASSLPAFTATYPVPASHREPDFLTAHGPAASSASCSTCHVREDCVTCHVPPQPRPVVAMIPRRATVAPGVGVERRAPVSHAAPAFARQHGNAAAANSGSCSMCHTRTMCADCHNEAPRPAPVAHPDPSSAAAPVAGRERTAARPAGFHPADYVARHSAEAYARRLECSNCHDSRLFCADCHASSGMAPARLRGRTTPSFHDAEPLWLLRHGQAARQGLESCTSCHRQADCMQCHSVLGAFKISPHGSDFDPRRAQKRNAAICLVCHITDPLGRNGT